MTVQDVEKSIQEIWELFKETDKEIKETNKGIKETDRILTEKFKETDKKIAQMSSKVDALTGKWGRFVEGLIVPAVESLLNARGIEVDKVFQRVNAHKNGKGMEVDILAIDKEYAVLIEAKSTLGVDDVKEHVQRLKGFKDFFPEYGEKKVLGCVAGIVIDEGADRYAYREGLFVIGQTGETVVILNDDKFKPKFW
jgi:hypothetical protein